MFEKFRIWIVSKYWFWRARNLFSRLGFRAEKIIHQRKVGLETVKNNARIGSELFWIGIKKFFLVGVLLFALGAIEHYAGMRFELKPWPSAEQQDGYNNQLEFYAILLAAIFSIYFATIGIILSTGYAKLNRDIIDLLVGEQVGSIYTNTLIFSTSFCLAVTALNVFGHQTGLLVYLLASFLTLVSILTLFPIGQRLFSFFELSPLIDGEILPKIAKNIDSVAKPGSSISFQNHFSREARRRLDQLFYIDNQLQGDANKLDQNLPLLSSCYSRLLNYYLQKKHQISEQSFWHPRKQFHPDWFLAGDTTTSMALTTVRRQINMDCLWLELREYLAHLLVDIRRHVYGIASAAV